MRVYVRMNELPSCYCLNFGFCLEIAIIEASKTGGTVALEYHRGRFLVKFGLVDNQSIIEYALGPRRPVC